MKFFFNCISILFHPLLAIFYAVLILLYPFGFLVARNVELQWISISIVFIYTFVLPTLFILLLRYFKIISSIKLQNRKERLIPYLFTALFYIHVWILLKNITLFEGIMANAFIISAVIIFVLVVFNFWIKVSAHVLSCCTVLGLILRLSFHYNEIINITVLILCLIVSGLIASSRLYLNAHTIKEVSIASLIGLGFGILTPNIF
jgi:hypothetical protein